MTKNVGTTLGVQVGQREAILNIDSFPTGRAEWTLASETRSTRHPEIALLSPTPSLALLWPSVAMLPFWFPPQQKVGVGLAFFIIIET